MFFLFSQFFFYRNRSEVIVGSVSALFTFDSLKNGPKMSPRNEFYFSRIEARMQSVNFVPLRSLMYSNPVLFKSLTSKQKKKGKQGLDLSMEVCFSSKSLIASRIQRRKSN
ncbi:hypothetical protein CEXT_645211 [Caerostris extrusa]|uniref:Uncharacterized protein n=1 Tax=Caerostris extrusa TaxID=172846 RepID=A0AAV4WRZ9_CAEEX|nr:hypothetical protein CEXT_645211 [Caerostris extrusa]